MPIVLGADLAERFPDVLFQFRAVVDPLHDERVHRPADAGLDRAQFAVRRVSLALDRLAERRVIHLGELFLSGARRDRAPGGARVVEIPVLERKREAGADGAGLAENREALGAAALQPSKATPMHFRVLAGRHDHVMQHGTARGRSQPFEESEVVLDMAGCLGDLDETLVALAQHLGEIKDVLVAHRVGDHRRAVEISLGGIRAKPLDRKSAQPRVHPFREQPAHRRALFGTGRAALRRLESHHVGHQRGGRHVLDAVDALGRAVERVEVLRDGFPVPRHPVLHRVVGNRLGARHREHRAFAEFRPYRREAEAAVAQHYRGDTVPSGNGAVRIPADLRVVVGMKIDEAGRDDRILSVDHKASEAGRAAADLRDLALANPDVGAIARHAGAVDHRSIFDMEIEVSHLRFPP